MLIKLIPLLNILETKPTTSPVIPPPTAITRSVRLKFLEKFFKVFDFFIDLFFSLAEKEETKHLYFF